MIVARRAMLQKKVHDRNTEKCAVFRTGPYRFFFYAGDRDEPPHIHVERENFEAKFWIDPDRLARSHWRLSGNGRGIHWPDLDEDISVENLLAGQSSGESQMSFRRWLQQRSNSKTGQ